jgi:hypothetical protein
VGAVRLAMSSRAFRAVLLALVAVPALAIAADSAGAATTGRLAVRIDATTGEAVTSGTLTRIPFTGTQTLSGLAEGSADGDGVLIAFESGDPDRPLVIGGLWSSREEPPTRIACVRERCALSGGMVGVGRVESAEVDLRTGRLALELVFPRAVCLRCSR